MRDCLVYGRIPGIWIGFARSFLLNPSIDLRIGILARDKSKWGKARDVQNIAGESVVVFPASQSPTLYDPSFMKTFRTRRGGVDIVRVYREDSSRSDVLAVDWTEDIQVTSSICARRIDQM